VRVATLDDPRLYQAVCGRLKLMISARSHPLILAAGMGVPGIGLGHDGLFKDCFDPLGVPRRVIGTDEIRHGLQAESIVALADDALDDPTDLRACAEGLRRRVHEAVAARLDRRDPEPGTPAVPARPAAPARPAPAWPPPERSLPQLR
jgi:polysaccharide pyruvyl transferase WcaK-like protein